jgi:hypothetical protein
VATLTSQYKTALDAMAIPKMKGADAMVLAMAKVLTLERQAATSRP